MNTKYVSTYISKLFVVMIASMLLMTSCASYDPLRVMTSPPLLDGAMLNLFEGTAKMIVKSCIDGASLAEVYVKNGVYVFARQLSEGYGFVGMGERATLLSKTQTQDIVAKYTTTATFSQFVDYLKAGGWKQVTAAEIPVWAKEFAKGTSSVTLSAAQSMISIIAFPGGLYSSDPFDNTVDY